MAFTEKKRRFVDALRRGMVGQEAAKFAGYSERGASQAASRLMKDKDVLAALERHEKINKAKEEAKAQGKPLNIDALSKMYSDPKDFLSAVMNDSSEEVKLRVDSAKTLMPYFHTRKAEVGKKEQAQAKADDIANNRFAPRSAPRLLN